MKKDPIENASLIKGNAGRIKISRKEGSAELTLDYQKFRGATKKRPGKFQFGESSGAKFIRFRAPLSHFRLEELAKLDPNEIVEIIANKHSGFMELLSGDTALRPDMMALVMKILAKLSVAPFHEIKTNMMALACRQEFLDQLRTFVSELPTGNRQHQSTENVIFEDLFTFYKCVLEMLPNTACDVFRSVFLYTDMSLKGVEMYQKVKINVDLKNTFNALQDYLKEIIQEKDLKKETHLEYPEPPNNFREMSVVPTNQDITSEKSLFIRPNIIKGAYSDVEHYLDVQFRLLREDFIGPLREGISEYLNNTDENTVILKTSTLRFYNKVLFLTTKSTKDGVGVLVNFDPYRRRRIENWKDSKKFMYGSLLCFTSDNFKSTIIATVIERDEIFTKRILVVKFHSPTQMDENVFKREFIMAESEVYFNSYFHVLQGLQNLRKENFPMKEYIVDVNCICRPPMYVDVAEREFSFRDFKIHPKDVESWPGFEALGLNPAQYDALIAATTREFVIIQGPPGTGKTYLGLKIINFLLQNTSAWNMQGQPILIICHTNHALDQFLEGIAGISDSIVRIGGQSKSNILQKYNLKEIRKATKTNSHNYNLSRHFNDVMADLTSEIQRKQKQLELIKKNEGILWMKYLVDRNIVPSCFPDVLRTSIVEWLLVPPEEWLKEEEGLYDEAQQFHEQENPVESHTENSVSELNNTLLDEVLVDSGDDETDHMFDFRPAPIFHDKEDIYDISVEKLNKQLKDIEDILENSEGGDFDRNLWFFETLYDDLTYQKKCLKACLCQVIPEDEDRVKELATESDVWRIEPRDRWLLYKHWLSLLQAELLEELIQAGKDFTENSRFHEEVRNMNDLRILKERFVVGMTTTGAARLQPLLQALRPSIVIVEEAAEVLEPHIVVSLTKDCQHLILIGDHKQLRPSNAVFKLAQEFKFDVSLFERMLNNGLHCKVLQIQHRMRPEIAELITPTIYPGLMNHSSVETYPNVKGMLKNVYFVKHNKPEAQERESSSRSNRHEAEFLLALCKYLILQGYDGEDITILTTYSGQMFYLREVRNVRMDPLDPPDYGLGCTSPYFYERSRHLMLRKVRMTVVDNFQGEENKIILLSLVRSNKNADIGFLKTPNRVCVALSRAREGLYIIGNMDNLTERSTSIWGKIKETLVKQEALGTHLTLRCQKFHLTCSQDMNTRHMVSGCRLELRRFDHVYQAGSQFQFQNMSGPPVAQPGQSEHFWTPLLEHVVAASPNLYDPFRQNHPDQVTLVASHEDFKQVKEGGCNLPCGALLKCGHTCKSVCHQKDLGHENKKCLEPCERILCALEHSCKKMCWQDCGPCTYLILKTLPCGHETTVQCHVTLDDIMCEVVVSMELPYCKHKVDIPCGVDLLEFNCPFKCEYRLMCGHSCNKTCHPLKDPEHLEFQCKKKCVRLNKGCSRAHECQLLCYKECVDCSVILEPQTLPCGHSHKLKCSQDPATVKCEFKCKRTLPCGHLCTSHCYKPCAPCGEMVAKFIPDCNHKVYMRCSKEALRKYCNKLCERTMECGHKCPGKCALECSVLSCNVLVPYNIQAACGHAGNAPCCLAKSGMD
uniref:NFX1-type zinc finger-containing protein 1 n=1 Tax=Timema genevievae TaxID=629358 RepID=A0A7R9PPP0_TIMGE|nr:unnamed protein product [Timema genevievae]